MDAIQTPRTIGRRRRAARVEARMLNHSEIYNSAALLRDSWHGSEERREECARNMALAVTQALQAKACDCEAVLYAIADSICCSPLGTPWEV